MPAEPLQFAKYIDIVVLPILTIVISVLLIRSRRQHGKLGSTISETLAGDARHHLMFSVTMSVLYPLYYTFLWFWVGPYTDMPLGYYALLLIAVIAEMIFVWIPAKGSRQLKIHVLTAGVVGICMLTTAFLVLLAGLNISFISKVLLLLFMSTAPLIVICMFFEKTRRYSFAYETIYIVLFLIAFSSVAHL